jgi:type I restriction enzyme S subunit
MSEYKTYLTYKDAEVRCLGSIPKHWENRVLKYIFSENKDKNTGGIENHILSLSYGKVISKKGGENFGLIPESFDTYQIINPDYLVFRFTDLQNDHKSLRVGYSDKKGIITSAYLGLKKRKEDIHSKYFYYLFHSLDTQKYFYGFGGGVRLSINWNTLSKIKYPVPQLSEQIAITNFLDKKTGEIERLISDKEITIKLLKEKAYKLSINGFQEPNQVSEWEDNFPNDWGILKAKWIFNEIKIKNKPQEELLAVTQNRGVLPKSMCSESFVSPDEKGLLSQKLVIKESFVISLRSFQGGIEFSYYQGIVSPAYTVFVIKEEFDNEKSRIFYKYFLKSKPFIELLNTIISGIRDGQNISFTDFSTLNIPLPDIKTLESVFALDKLIIEQEVKTKKEIILLKEYQQSLISEAVTGKIDVREI